MIYKLIKNINFYLQIKVIKIKEYRINTRISVYAKIVYKKKANN